MDGTELSTLCTEINGGDPIGDTLVYQLLNLAKAIIEQRRPWMILRRTNSSKTVTTANTWQTAIDLSTITGFNRFYGEVPVKLFDGNVSYYEYIQKPIEERLRHIQSPSTFVFDENAKFLYLNGTAPIAGTLWIDHIIDSPDIDANSSWVFPSWSHPLLAFYAVGIHKGGIDFDDINMKMAPDNRAQAATILQALTTMDDEKQRAAQQNADPYRERRAEGDFRPNTINIG